MMKRMDPVLRKDMKLADTPNEKTRRLNRPRSSMGAGARSSQAMNAATSAIRARAARSMRGDVQPSR